MYRLRGQSTKEGERERDKETDIPGTYIYTGKRTGRKADRQTNGQADRQTDKSPNRPNKPNNNEKTPPMLSFTKHQTPIHIHTCVTRPPLAFTVPPLSARCCSRRASNSARARRASAAAASLAASSLASARSSSPSSFHT